MLRSIATILSMLTVFVSLSANAGTWSRVEPVITKASYATGVPAATLAGFAYTESRFKPKAVSTSNAKGLVQITPRTWRHLVRTYGKKHGIARNANPYNPLHSALMAGEYINENKAILKRALKRKPTDGELYLAYLISPQKAIQVIKAPGWKVAANIVPGAVKGQKRFFYTKHHRKHSVREFRRAVYAEIDGHIDLYKDRAVIAKKKYVKAKKTEVAMKQMKQCFAEHPAIVPEYENSILLTSCDPNYASGRLDPYDRRRYM